MWLSNRQSDLTVDKQIDGSDKYATVGWPGMFPAFSVAEAGRNLVDLRLFSDDGTFAEKGVCTKPVGQDADLTNHQVITDVNRRRMSLRVPEPKFFADWTEIDLKQLWG